ncbi:MAG: DUF2071 domain-containing protein, partial [Bacteroidia bacterium]|nr:DUF2071 domain-containing protein [Bacteroidia bacterium]
MRGKFLEAEWRKLVIFNFEVDPELLKKYLPAFTELDDFNGKHLISLVGFQFKNTKVWGIKWPWHVNFLEVNLRFYVRRKMPDGSWRRGVSFVKEMVPHALIATAARRLYGEPYE